MKQSPHRNNCSCNFMKKNLCVTGAPPKISGTSHYFSKTKAACDACNKKDTYGNFRHNQGKLFLES